MLGTDAHAAFLAAAEKAEWMPDDVFREARLDEIFERAAPLDLDLGCGDGAFLLAMAARSPERNFLGTERLIGRVNSVRRKIAQEHLANARVLRLESLFTVRHLLPPGCVSVAHVAFPDPWPKRHHHPRRLFQDEFMAALHRVLAPEGEVRVKTDDLPYFQWIEKVFARAQGFARVEWDEEADYPRTDFERLFVARGMPIHRARLRRL